MKTSDPHWFLRNLLRGHVGSGNATINRPNIFVMNEVFYLPKLEHKQELLRQTVGGWELNAIFTAENGNSICVKRCHQLNR